MSVFYHLRAAIRAGLGGCCARCGTRSGLLDIHHVKHDGTAWRERFGIPKGADESQYKADSALAYYTDILWGLMLNLSEVQLLCRECHKKHHAKFGYDEIE